MSPVAVRVSSQQQRQVDAAEPKADYEHLSVADALKQLGVSMATGLSAVEANQRLNQYGPNELEEKKTSALARSLILRRGSRCDRPVREATGREQAWIR